MVKVLIALLIIACIAPLFIKGPDGEPIMTLDDWKFDLPDSLADLMPESANSAADVSSVSEPTTVYKWQDEDGQWHFSNTPPNTTEAEEMELSGDINIMEAYVPPEEPEHTAATPFDPGMTTGPMTASPDQVKEMMETVTNLQETIDQRKADMDKIAQPALDDGGD